MSAAANVHEDPALARPYYRLLGLQAARLTTTD